MVEQDSDAPISIQRRTAQSGKIDYGSPTILHETSKSRISLIPFFIPRSAGTELGVKIQTLRKSPDPLPWALVEDKSISLNAAASVKLLQALQANFKVAESEGSGDFILIRVNDGEAHFSDHDPAAVTSAIIKVLSQPDISAHLSQTELTSEIIGALRGSIRLSEMQRAVAELRQLLDSGVADESVYQRWCEEHFWVFGNAYVMRDEVRRFSASDQADMLLANTASGFRDILELKRPDMPVLRRDDAHRNHYFSSELSKAIGQCHRYLDVFSEMASIGLRDHPEVVAHHPRAIIVIGRSCDWDKEQNRALRGLTSRLHGISVMTYDQLLYQAERLIEIIKPKPDDDVDSEHFGQDIDDEIPF